MEKKSVCARPRRTMKEGDKYAGFLVEKVTPLPDLRMTAYQAVHEKSGAKFLHLHSKDIENLFAVAFRTPPFDNTGLPHILEHTVLCGSKKYPVKDPLVELCKSSLATFLNAMTYIDKTVYPCASVSKKDFFNLASVYCDAVFFPLINEKHFKQEGHHFDFEETGDQNSGLTVKGVVYNEMKGNYSDLDNLIYRHMRRSIFPDNAYGFDSGGDPAAIPQLTYQTFKNFHSRYYHPSNAFFFIYGDIPTKKHLIFLDKEYLSRFERTPIDTAIASQPRWSEPRYEIVPYPIAENENPERKTAVLLTFLTNDVNDRLKTLGMAILDMYLLGNDASPLRKALNDSGLGEKLTPSGYVSGQRDTYFTVGLKGTDEEKKFEIVDLVKSTCLSVLEQGLNKKKVDAVFHQIELGKREMNEPLSFMDSVYASWIYGGDPLQNLNLNEQLAELRRKIESGEGFLENLLKESVVANNHYSLVSLVPDKERMKSENALFASRMKEVKAAMSEADLNLVVTEAEELKKMQETPNSSEALATLPHLALKDVPLEPTPLGTVLETAENMSLLYTDKFANGVNYLNIAFDLAGIDPGLIPFLSFFETALCGMGAAGKNYAEMEERQAESTGGIWTSIFSDDRAGQPFQSRVQPVFAVCTKAIDAKLREMAEILWDRILRCDFSDTKRLKDLFLQERTGLRGGLLRAGSGYAMSYASRNFSTNCLISEKLRGLSRIRLADNLADNFEARKDEILRKFSLIKDFILSRGWGQVTASFVGAEEQFLEIKKYLPDFLSFLRGGKAEQSSIYLASSSRYYREAISFPTSVAFTALVFPSVGISHPDSPALHVLSHILTYDYLWKEIREKGGAYGGNASYNPMRGVFGFGSYRDPEIKRTLDVYDRAFDYLVNEADLSSSVMEQAIIGVMSDFEKPVRPSEAATLALWQYFCGITEEFRKNYRRQLLSVRGDDLRRTAEAILKSAHEQSSVCVIASKEKIEEANSSMAHPLSMSGL